MSAARIKLSKPEYAIFGSQNFLEVISAYAPPTDLTQYYKKTETSSAVEISSALENVIVSPLSGLTYNLAQEGASTKLLVAVGRALGATVLE